VTRWLIIGLVAAFGIVAAPAGAASAKTVWLCQPGMVRNPCTPGLSTTAYSPSGAVLGIQRPRSPRRPQIDCFYVYPTVSGQKTGNSDLQVNPEERSIALMQVARYSQYCRVFAPMYRQVTLAGIGLGQPTTKPSTALALADVRSAFQDYL
jgi:hypothetical protein